MKYKYLLTIVEEQQIKSEFRFKDRKTLHLVKEAFKGRIPNLKFIIRKYPKTKE